MSELARKSCVPCRGGVPPLSAGESDRLLKQLHEDWRVVGGHHLERDVTFSDFKDALAYANRVGAVAETEQHHPDIYLAWGRVTLKVWTHAIDGLTESDFVLAAKADEALSE